MKYIKANIEVLDSLEEQRIHDASIDILGKVGIHMPEKNILTLFEAAGADIDRDTQIIKIPEELVLTVLEKIRDDSSNTTEHRAIPNLGITVTPQPFIADYPGKYRRYGTLNDVIKGIVITNRLRHLIFANPIVVPNDVPVPISDLYSYQALYMYTNNPGNAYINSEWSASYIIELASVLDSKVSYLLEPVSPLRFTEEHLRLALLFAKHGHVLSIGPMVIAGLSGPATLAGTLAVQNAEILSSIVLVNLLDAKCNYRYTGGAHTMDMRTTICSFGSPNQVLLVLAERQMAKRYGLPCLGSLALSDSMIPDFQAGFEKGLSVAFSALAGVKWVGNQGHLGADQAASLEQMVIDDEWVDFLNYILRGFEVTDDTLGYDVIQRVGIGGSFLVDDHTGRHTRTNYWNSDLFTRLSWDAWENKGNSSIYDRANAKVMRILSEDYPPRPLISEELCKEIEKIIQRARDEVI